MTKLTKDQTEILRWAREELRRSVRIAKGKEQDGHGLSAPDIADNVFETLSEYKVPAELHPTYPKAVFEVI